VRERGWDEGSFSGIAGEAFAEHGSALQVGITGEASAEHVTARLFEPLSRARERGWGEGSFSGIAGEAFAEHGSALPVCGGCW